MKLIPNSSSIINLVNISFKYVIETSKLYNIDESHALKHSMDVFQFSKKIYKEELVKNPYLKNQREVIFMTAIGHDMCDKKYVDENEGIIQFQNYMSSYISYPKLDIIGQIIKTMSYSKVKVNGYPDLGEYQLAYHIVREADLLASYDIDRAIIYEMFKNGFNYKEALKDSLDLFEKRVFKLRKDKLFITNYSIRESLKLHKKAKENIKNLKGILYE